MNEMTTETSATPHTSDPIPVTRWDAARIPVELWGRRLDSYIPHGETSENALAVCQNYIGNFPTRRPRGKGLLFVGPPGVCKTTLACLTAMEIHRQGVNIRFAAFADYVSGGLVEQIKFRDLAKQGDERALERFWQIQEGLDEVNDRRLVVLDDVGQEHRTASDLAVDEFDRLLRYRERRGTPTFLTTIVPVKEWEKIYGYSMASFLNQAFTTVVILGADQRTQ